MHLSIFPAFTRRSLALPIYAAVILFPLVLRAELVWERKTVEVTDDIGSPVLEAHFKFTNKSKGPVEIRNVESSCGCTTTALEKRRYEPRENGEIVARYTVGIHTGLQKKTILVTTDDGRPPVTLTLEAHIKEILKITPAILTWPHAAPSAEKRLTVEWMPKTPLEDISVESSSPDVNVSIVPVTKGQKYDVLVTPKQTDHFLYAKLTIRCRMGDQEKTFAAFATVQPGAVGQ